jgi:hypothetical protein
MEFHSLILDSAKVLREARDLTVGTRRPVPRLINSPARTKPLMTAGDEGA